MSERWMPKHGDTFWYVSELAGVAGTTWEDDGIDPVFYESGNCFRTEAEAEAAAEKVKSLLLSLHYNETSTANDETLPDWCKVGEWVYCTKTNNYGKILSVDKEEVNICIPPDGTFSAKTNMMLKYGRTARLRPYNAEEMRGLIGKVIEDKIGNRCLMTVFTVVDNKIVAFNKYCSADDLLKSGYTIDGGPCGVLEHLENGEWVE